MSYRKMDIWEFGGMLLDSHDLDPIYCALLNVDMPTEQRHRWLVAYWCLYHAGAASALSEREGSDFWFGLMAAAENHSCPYTPDGRWPRAKERRHWRGDQAVRSASGLIDAYQRPEDMVQSLMEAGHNYADVATHACSHRGFGPWIAFKIADMLDRVEGHFVNFDQATVFMFKDPRQAALMLFEQQMGGRAKDEDQAVDSVVNHLLKVFDDRLAPPRLDRPVGLQEVETILCKWKSHQRGHYPPVNDLIEINEGLERCDWGETARAFRAAMPLMPPAERLCEWREQL